MARKTFFSVLLLSMAYCLIEGLSWLAIQFISSEVSSVAQIRQSRSDVLESKEPRSATAAAATKWEGVILHPYLGYAGDPSEKKFNSFGFRRAPGFLSNDPDTVLVAITGGSVAQQVWNNAGKHLAKALAEFPEFSGRKIQIISLSLFGYKEPQQLAGVAYYLTLGGRFDIVINIDGFNEIGSGRNIEAFQSGKTHPSFPSPKAWVPLSGAISSPAATAMAGEIRILRSLRLGFAESVNAVDWNITANLIWLLTDRLLATRILERNDQIVQDVMGRHRANHAATVPPDQVFDYVAKLWMRTSLQIEYLGRGNHFSYYHFLQPNQYVPDSKPFTKREQEVARKDLGRFEDNVIKGYPLLRAAASRSREEGLRFYDLSEVFMHDEDEIYIDNCCHTNKRGSKIIADVIAKVIIEDLAATPCFDPKSPTPAWVSSRLCPR